MSEQIYHQAPTTSRSARRLSRMHDFSNPKKLAKFLPEDAKVIDVGAGASDLGATIAGLRPDIMWVNFDYSYKDPLIAEEVGRNGTPENLSIVCGDATRLSEMFRSDTFDAVFSYWLMPHMSLGDDDQPARDMAEGIWDISKEGALISVGPSPGILGLRKYASRFDKNHRLDREIFVEDMLAITALRGLSSSMQSQMNKGMAELFGTSRYCRNKQIIDPATGNFVDILSTKGLAVLYRLEGVIFSSLARGLISQLSRSNNNNNNKP